MTIEHVAQIVHEANRAYCETICDDSQVAWVNAPDWQKESAINGVRGIVSDVITTPEQAHESWLLEKANAGWTFGAVKDADKKEHPCMVPYAQLPAAQQAKDAIFFAIVRTLRPYIDPSVQQ